MQTPELAGVTIIGAGAFNPAIVHPTWLADKGLIPRDMAEHATEPAPGRSMVVSPQLSSFVADWLTVQVTQNQAVFMTVDQGREIDLRDFAKGFFNLLPETPIDALGINADSHFRTENEAKWHAFGDKFLPKDFWEPLFESEKWRERPGGKHVGMRVMTVEVNRNESSIPGHVRVELAPSLRVLPHGVYVGINAHFQLTKNEQRSNGGAAAHVLGEEWEGIRALENTLVAALGKEI